MMTRTMSSYRASVWITAIAVGAALYGAAGCALSADLLEDDSGSSKAGNDGSCTPEDCGMNSAYVNGYPVDELHLQAPATATATGSGGVSKLMSPGLPNIAGVRVTGFLLPSGLPATLFARHGELYALRNGITHKGDQLVFGKIIIDREGTADVIVINEYEYLQGAPWLAPVHNYLFTYAPEEMGFDKNTPSRYFTVPVCRVAADLDREDLTRAVILTRERYKHELVTQKGNNDDEWQVMPEVSNLLAYGWFNIACQGTALNKQRWWGYYPDAPFSGEGWSWQDRQAVLKSIVNDPCGMNLSFTETGTPLAWHNGAFFLSRPEEWLVADMEVESIWTEDGAVCFNTPREPAGSTNPAALVNQNCHDLVQNPCPDTQEALSNLQAYGTIVTLVVPQ